MKTKLAWISLISVLGFIISGCNKETESNDNIETLKLNKQLVLVDKTTTVGKLHIVSGNGGYTLVLPKTLSVDAAEVTYSESILKLSIDASNDIVVERTLLNNQMVSGLFIVKDSKGAKRLFAVDAFVIGYWYDFDELEPKYFNDPDYWQ